MDETNQTNATNIYLLGFQRLQKFRIPFVFLLLLIYCLTIVAIAVVYSSHLLHYPMYFFLSHLSLSDILLTTNIVPNMLPVIANEGSVISLSGLLLLTVMSYDRYLAICRPLHYSSVMNRKLCLQLVSGSWGISSFISMITAILISKLKFCSSKIVDHFFCDLAPLLAISCSDTFAVELDNALQATPLTIFPIIFITTTYIRILQTVLKIPFRSGIQKTLSTCSSHLIVVCTFYGTLFSLYVVPSKEQPLCINKILSLLYTVLTPLMNPIIYSLRNTEIKVAITKYMTLKTL
ncbi:hypothetical protein GDO86_001061 [Hymenochirus boettgeri]|uniref:Olfactory receptor n=1 Tax=Hymenochirus boettgeri TaxID=247094 RepID=A0A8T2KB65_9PIPI|nr:hypothetical protein GDO86_001061 [Hymenochirus boettgeri]